jgi:hypothetical protein
VYGNSQPTHLQERKSFYQYKNSSFQNSKPKENIKNLPMRAKTQILLMQNYERVK